MNFQAAAGLGVFVGELKATNPSLLFASKSNNCRFNYPGVLLLPKGMGLVLANVRAVAIMDGPLLMKQS